MATDYRINLSKTLTSSPGSRKRFYHGMLLYLALCSVGLVIAAYFAGLNAQQYLENRQERKQLLRTVSAVADLDESVFKDPDMIYSELQVSAGQVEQLKLALARRVQILPIIHNLFIDLPENVALQSLSANRTMLSFGLVMPPPSEEAGDPVRELKAIWESNEELGKRVASIRPVTGERRTVGSESFFYVQFECTLSK